jgi:nitrite reductase/ring-hydroxylating ferredoxin subunit
LQKTTFSRAEASGAMPSYEELVDASRSTVSPRVFHDPQIYDIERDAVFGHSWLYLGHRSQLPHPGNFFTTYMGEDAVVVLRDRDSHIRAYLNSCPHRGMTLCRKEKGTLKNIQCPFHGWTFNLEGELIGIPYYEEAYHNEMPLSKWGLIEVPRVESYRDLIFGSFDEAIEPLHEHLGDMRWYTDLIFGRTEHGVEVLPGTHKLVVHSNWKQMSENLGGDNAHVPFTHEWMSNLFYDSRPEERGLNFQGYTENGHMFVCDLFDDTALVGPALAKNRAKLGAEAAKRLAPLQASLAGSESPTSGGAVLIGNIFPNFGWIEAFGWTLMRVMHPKGPGLTECWTWVVVDSEMPEEARAEARAQIIQQVAPPGTIEVDDTEVWKHAYQNHRAPYRSRFPLNYQMGRGHGTGDNDRPGILHDAPTEIGAFNFYEHWRDLMTRYGGPER